MAKPHIGFGSIQLGTNAGAAAIGPIPEQTPFRILICSDLSGRAARGLVEIGAKLASRRPLRVDRDNFEDVMAKLNVEIPTSAVSMTGPALRFRELDDFLPDRLIARLDAVQALRKTRDRLQNRSTFQEAAKEVRGWGQGASAAPAQPTQTPAAAIDPEDLLSQMLGETPGERPAPSSSPQRPEAGGPDLSAILQQIAAPYLVPGADPHQEELVGAVDEAIAAHLRALLHHPIFQGIEAAWRALWLLVRRLDTDQQLQIHLLDVSRDELLADLDAVENLKDSGVYHLLVEQTVGTPGALPWAVVAGDYLFDQTRVDVEFLGRLAQIVSRSGAPFLAGVSSHVLGCESLAATPDPRDWTRKPDPEGAAAWQLLRKLPEASSLGLALPRFILRLPYGKDGTPAETFQFEELRERPANEHYLWGNPAFAAVYLLGEAFTRHGWSLKPGMVRDLGGLPMAIELDDGDKRIKPCAEALLADRATSAILNQGLMPLLSIKDSDGASLVSFQSLAEPSAPLRARWS
jgi:type VI secretion system protein ImpC